MITHKRQLLVDFLNDQPGIKASLSPWGIYIELPAAHEDHLAVIELRLADHDVPYAPQDDLILGALYNFSGKRGIIRGNSYEIETLQ